MQYPPFPLKVSISPQRSWPRLLLAAFVAVVFIAVAVIVETSERARGLGDFGLAVYVIRASLIGRPPLVSPCGDGWEFILPDLLRLGPGVTETEIRVQTNNKQLLSSSAPKIASLPSGDPPCD